jgi:hypothetical protein
MEIIQGVRTKAREVVSQLQKGVELEKIRIISRPAGRSLEESVTGVTACIAYTGWPQLWIEAAVGHHYDVQHYVSLQVEARSNSCQVSSWRLPPTVLEMELK